MNDDIQPTESLEIMGDTAPTEGEVVYDPIGNQYRVTKSIGPGQLHGTWRIEGKLVKKADTQ